jgi:hypothetical protein
MRQKLNENPLLQVAVIGILLVIVGIFVLSSMGGASEEETTATTSAATVSPPEEIPAAEVAAVSPTGATGSTAVPQVPAPPLPKDVTKAFQENQTVALLVVKRGGIEDRMVAASVRRLGTLPKVAAFVVPADQIARYTAITQGVMVERVPALIVIRPKHLDGSIAAASLSYGFQSPESILQAVVDANYKGSTLSYHP